MIVFRSLKKNILFVAMVTATLAFTACNDDKKETPKTTTTETPTTKTTPKNDTKKDGDIALNPAHGEPGHRCDIPVGAPLNAPSRTKIQTQTQTKTSPVIKKTHQKTETTAKKNPPHGQPGHRCDIPVGAALDS